MALTSLILVVAEHRRRAAVREAGWWYAVMTQLGFVALLVAMTVYAAAAGGDSFAALRAAHLSPALSSIVFVLLFAGFGSKAGLVPVHVWLPKAHPEAPSPVSAMLSAAMVNLGVYGVIRFGFDLLHGGLQWWWLLVLAVGAVSALFGILQAAVATDLKGLLAYSTVENMGLIFLGVGAAGLLLAAGADRPPPWCWPRRCCTWSTTPGSRRCCSARPVRCCARPACATSTSSAVCVPGCRSPPSCSESAPCALRPCHPATGSSPSGCCFSRSSTPSVPTGRSRPS